MKQRLEQFNEWYLQLAPRERVLTALGAAAVLATLLFLALWEPLAKAHLNNAEALDAARAIASRLETAAATVKKAHQGGRGAALNRNLSLLSAVDQAAKSGTLGAAPSRLQPEGDREVKVWLDDVAFDRLLRWLNELETRYGVVAQSAEIERESGPGLVNARLSLVRP